MQNSIQKFGQSSIVFKKPGILSEKLKTLTSFNYQTLVSTKERGIFLFCLEIEFCQIKNLVSTHSQKPGLSVTQDLNKLKKKIPLTLLYTFMRRKCVQTFSKNIRLYGSCSSSKFSIFQTNNLVSRKYKSFA